MNTDKTGTTEFKNFLPKENFQEAAEIYEAAFGEKFSFAIPGIEDRVALIRDGFKPEYSISAFSGDRLVGLAGFQTPAGSFTGGITAGSIISRIGLIRGIRACILLAFYERKPKKAELIMDGIAVHHDYRGRGIGTELLKRVVNYASDHGFVTVRLDVIDRNNRAMKLYERFGFKVIREENYPYLKPLLGFGGSYIMEYRIS